MSSQNHPDLDDELMFRRGILLLREPCTPIPPVETKTPLPLKFVANNKMVNWDRKHNVTGIDVYSSRIGSKNAGDSDW